MRCALGDAEDYLMSVCCWCNRRVQAVARPARGATVVRSAMSQPASPVGPGDMTPSAGATQQLNFEPFQEVRCVYEQAGPPIAQSIKPLSEPVSPLRCAGMMLVAHAGCRSSRSWCRCQRRRSPSHMLGWTTMRSARPASTSKSSEGFETVHAVGRGHI
jgi:hypothetical protein